MTRTRFVLVLALVPFGLSACNGTKKSSAEPGTRSTSTGATQQSASTDRTPQAASKSMITAPFSMWVECYAPHRWTWTWEMKVEESGKYEIIIHPDEYGEAPDDLVYQLKPEQITAIMEALNRADFMNLDAEYGNPRGPVRRTIRLTTHGETKEVKFTARHATLHEIPMKLLEAWLVIRSTWSEYRAHDGQDYIKQYINEVREGRYQKPEDDNL